MEMHDHRKKSVLSRIRQGKNPFGLPLPEFEWLGLEVELKSKPFSQLSTEESLLLFGFEFLRPEEIPVSHLAYLTQLAKENHAYALFLLGEGYRKGVCGLELNLPLALSLHRKAYDQGIVDSLPALALLNGLRKDERKKVRRNLDALVGEDWALELLADHFLLNGKTKTAQELLESALSHGRERALPLLLHTYLHGPKRFRNPKRALSLALLGERLHLDGMSLVAGDGYFLGRGTKRNLLLAKRHYLRMEENPYAQKRLGDIERSFHHPSKALGHYEKAVAGKEDSARIPFLFLQANRNKNPSERRKLLLQLEEIAKNRTSLYYPLSRLAYRLGFARLGKRCFRKSIKSKDKRALLSALLEGRESELANSIYEEGRRRGKFACIEKAIERKKGNRAETKK